MVVQRQGRWPLVLWRERTDRQCARLFRIRSNSSASTALQPLPCMHVLTTAPRPFPTGRTAALRPIDAPEGAWRVADGSNGWKDVPSVRLLTEAAMAQVIALDELLMSP